MLAATNVRTDVENLRFFQILNFSHLIGGTANLIEYIKRHKWGHKMGQRMENICHLFEKKTFFLGEICRFYRGQKMEIFFSPKAAIGETENILETGVKTARGEETLTARP